MGYNCSRPHQAPLLSEAITGTDSPNWTAEDWKRPNVPNKVTSECLWNLLYLATFTVGVFSQPPALFTSNPMGRGLKAGRMWLLLKSIAWCQQSSTFQKSADWQFVFNVYLLGSYWWSAGRLQCPTEKKQGITLSGHITLCHWRVCVMTGQEVRIQTKWFMYYHTLTCSCGRPIMSSQNRKLLLIQCLFHHIQYQYLYENMCTYTHTSLGTPNTNLELETTYGELEWQKKKGKNPAELVCGSGWTRLNDCTPVSSYWSMIDSQVVKKSGMEKISIQLWGILGERKRHCTATHTHTYKHTQENCNLHIK